MITVNGAPAPTAAGLTLSVLLAGMGLDPGARGVAIAVDGEVVSRGRWAQFELPDDCRVEVLTAMQGG